MTLKGASLLSRLVNQSAHLWFAVHVAEFARYRGVHGELTRPYDGWQSEGRMYIVLVKANQQVSAEPQMKSTT